jgi:hypothetical protein
VIAGCLDGMTLTEMSGNEHEIRRLSDAWEMPGDGDPERQWIDCEVCGCPDCEEHPRRQETDVEYGNRLDAEQTTYTHQELYGRP